jgi:hypothetical protein
MGLFCDSDPDFTTQKNFSENSTHWGDTKMAIVQEGSN